MCALDVLLCPRGGGRRRLVALVTGAGEQQSLRGVLPGPRQTLLVLAGDEIQWRYADLITRTTDRSGDQVAGYLVVIADAPPPGAGAAVADPTLGVHGRLGAAADTVLLVRPDRCVAFRGEPPDPAALEAYLGELFIGAS